MTPDTSTHCPLIHIHESELADWYGIGWHFVGASPTKPDFVVIEWQLKRAPVMPFKMREEAI